MSNAIKDQLWRLINSLNKAEKRNFKIYSKRAGGTSETKFIRLFDVLDKLPAPDDTLVLKRMKINQGQLSNLKRHLYQEVLTSLRMIHIDKEIDIELREQIDFVRILYGKGHYIDALRTLERAKAKAVEHNQDLLQLEIIEFQKMIEARHITLSRQVDNKMDLLLNESAEKSYSFLNTSELFNLNIQIHGRYIENGHSRNLKELVENEEFWHQIQTRRVDRETVSSTFHQKINRFQAAMWYNYIQLQLEEALEAALNAITLFQLSQQMIFKDPDLYMRCIYYVTVLAYLHNRGDLIDRYVNRLEHFLEDENIQLNTNSRRIGNTYLYLASSNALFIHGKYQEAYELSHKVHKAYTDGDFRPNNHRWGLFLYKQAAAAFLIDEYDEALDYLNEVIYMKSGILRQDLLINTRLLHAICNYELGNFSLVDYHLTGIARLLRRSKETAEVHKLGVSGLRRLLSAPPAERGDVYPKLAEELNELSKRPYEAKALAYLDLREWVARS
ncbi:MAG: hypothetical protein ACJAZ9_001100 [Neolewinella sp.]|jgi:hypothetical protein